MISLIYFSSRDLHLHFFLCHRWQQMFCENINVEFSLIINNLFSTKFTISILDLIHQSTAQYAKAGSE